MNEKIDETLWASIGYRLGQLLGEGFSAGDLTQETAAPALLGLKAGLRDYGTAASLAMLAQMEHWTVEDIMGIRDRAGPEVNS